MKEYRVITNCCKDKHQSLKNVIHVLLSGTLQNNFYYYCGCCQLLLLISGPQGVLPSYGDSQLLQLSCSFQKQTFKRPLYPTCHSLVHSPSIFSPLLGDTETHFSHSNVLYAKLQGGCSTLEQIHITCSGECEHTVKDYSPV